MCAKLSIISASNRARLNHAYSAGVAREREGVVINYVRTQEAGGNAAGLIMGN